MSILSLKSGWISGIRLLDGPDILQNSISGASLAFRMNRFSCSVLYLL
jgi:hypothetical protein